MSQLDTLARIAVRLRSLRSWRGDCYEAAFRMMMDAARVNATRGLRLVQGRPWSSTYRRNIGHAWVELASQDAVFDITSQGEVFRVEEYYRLARLADHQHVGDPLEVRRYTLRQVERMAQREGHYGPWGEGLAPIRGGVKR